MDLQQLDFDLPVPGYAHPGDAGMDLYAAEPVTVTRETVLIPTGVAVAVLTVMWAWCAPAPGSPSTG